MESESTISKLNSYKQLHEQNSLDDFIDYLICKKIINETDYDTIYNNRSREIKLLEIFKIIDSRSRDDSEKVFTYLDLTYPNNKKLRQDEEDFRISCVRGGLPKLPPHYVSRRSLEWKTSVEDLKSKLLAFQWDQKLVVHGMMGYGKSCLVNEVLNDTSIRKCFENLLFWINLGEHHSKETVLKPLWRLYTTASGIVHNKISQCPDDIQIIKDLLIKLFSHERLKSTLLILDDACSDEVLSYFDIGCKTVITTQNKKILQKEECLFIEVKTGFSRTESLDLFKKSLKTNNDLPVAAEEIHEICKGHPMLIALIGSYLSENAELVINNDPEIWQYIKVMFLRGEYNLNEFDNNATIPTAKIKNCIEKLLSNGLREFYQDLAIFMPDVNIPPEVLEILWNEERFQVINKMNKFAEKSLIVPFYHNDLRTYIYGIHDIHLTYLKDVTKERIVSLHKKLISGYDRITKGNYATLPNDNYTLQFIGYHLYKAEVFQKFNIYFDLKFLEAKIRAVGKEDVLKDMVKYEIYITKNDSMLKEKLLQYKDFISRCGSSLYSYEETDIIQFGLREKKESFIFKEALPLAEGSQNLYFQLQRPVNDLEYSTINIKDDITCACYVNSPQHILIGTSSGKIKLFFEDYDKEISSFVGHEAYIKKLIISPDKHYFLSVSKDVSVILWKFPIESARNSFDFSNQILGSPKIKQKSWRDIYTPDGGRVKATRRFQLDEKDDYLESAAFCDQFPEVYRIATGSHRGIVIIWDAYSGERLYTTGYMGYSISCIIYQENEMFKRVIYAYEDSIAIYKINTKLEYNQTLHNQDVCQSIFVSDSKIIVVSSGNITFWEKSKPQRLFEKVAINKQHECSALTDDSNYLIVSTSKGTVFIWDIEDNKMVKEFKSKGLAKSLDTFYDEDRSVHLLLIGSDQRSLQQCHILPSENEPHIAITPKFIPFWKKKHALTALVNESNQIQVFNGYVQFSETDKIESRVTCTCFSSCGQYVIYGLENGEIYIFNLRFKKTLLLEMSENNQGPITYLNCYKPNNPRHQSVSSCESGDSLNFDFSFEGIIVSVSGNNLITVYNNGTIINQQLNRPLIYYYENNMIVIDSTCQIYILNLITNSFASLKNPALFDLVSVSKAAFCPEKSILAVVYKQMGQNFLDVYSVLDNKSVKFLKRLELIDEVKSCCFSCDGSLLALGMFSGDIKIWNLNQKYKSVTLTLHSSPVKDLLFSPNIQPPILVSLGEYIAWWNLKQFQEDQDRKGRPKSIDILDNVSNELSSMNISHWADRKYKEGRKYLLSCVKLNGCAKYLSAAKDFNTFLAVDDKGKIYVMEIVSSNK